MGYNPPDDETLLTDPESIRMALAQCTSHQDLCNIVAGIAVISTSKKTYGGAEVAKSINNIRLKYWSRVDSQGGLDKLINDVNKFPTAFSIRDHIIRVFVQDPILLVPSLRGDFVKSFYAIDGSMFQSNTDGATRNLDKTKVIEAACSMRDIIDDPEIADFYRDAIESHSQES